MKVRYAVKENRLPNPSLVTDKDCAHHLPVRGKGWICEINKQVAVFSIEDIADNNIRALFVAPGTHGVKEIKFEMTHEKWTANKNYKQVI